MTDESLESNMPVKVIDSRQPFRLPPMLQHIQEDIDSFRKWGEHHSRERRGLAKIFKVYLLSKTLNQHSSICLLRDSL
jgi:hypothetical protein